MNRNGVKRAKRAVGRQRHLQTLDYEDRAKRVAEEGTVLQCRSLALRMVEFYQGIPETSVGERRRLRRALKPLKVRLQEKSG